MSIRLPCENFDEHHNEHFKDSTLGPRPSTTTIEHSLLGVCDEMVELCKVLYSCKAICALSELDPQDVHFIC